MPRIRNKVSDHDHLKEEDNFRGSAHAHCNLQYRKNHFVIPIWFHNGLDYDFHFVFRTIANNIKIYEEEENRDLQEALKNLVKGKDSVVDGKEYQFSDLKPIAKSEMNFVSGRWGIFVFLDSMSFFKGKLEELWHVVANHEEKHDNKGHP